MDNLHTRKPEIKTQDVVVMYTEQHLTLRQIAKLTGLSAPGVGNRLKRAGVSAKQGEWIKGECITCGKAFEVTRSRWKTSLNHYCSQDCYFASRENPNYRPWRQGQRIARIVVSQYFRLHKSHIVHHEDGNQRNNDRANLKVFKNQSKHMKYHRGNKKVRAVWDGSLIEKSAVSASL